MAEMRLIDANALKEKRQFFDCHECGDDCEIDYVEWENIENAPTIDAVPVVHGRWVAEIERMGNYSHCSECGCRCQGYVPNYKYCPNCGAKMDGQDATVPTKSDRGCSTCANDGYDMPQCRECTEHPGYPWYKRRNGGAEG